MTTPVINLSIAHSEGLFRDLLLTLDQKEQFKINICACSGPGLLAAMENSAEPTDVLLLHSKLLLNGFDVHETVKRKWPEIRTLIICSDDTYDVLGRLIKQGVNGILGEDCKIDTLVQAIISIWDKDYYYSEEMPTFLVNVMKNSVNRYPHITDKEFGVLQYMDTDLSYKEVALKTGLSKRAVEGYRDSLFNKLGTRTRQGLAKFALKYGISAIRANELQ